MLAAADGRFRQSFAELLLLSFFRRKKFRAQAALEIGKQYEAVSAILEEPLHRFDGHQHIQMIPGVLEALCEVLREKKLSPEYIRCSREPLSPYFRHPELWCRLKPVNWVKNGLLNVLGWMTAGKFRGLGLAPARVLGLLISGDLEYDLVKPLLPDFEALAARKDFQLELVMHPGYGIPAGGGIDLPGGIFEQFDLSPNRKKEYDCLLQLKK